MSGFRIAERAVGDDCPAYVIAEIGNNHNGDADKAERLIRAAAQTGVDAVKFQTFKARDIHNPTVRADAYPGFDASKNFETWVEYVETTELKYEHYPRLMAVAQECGVHFMSTPASMEALDFLVKLGVPALKVASMDLTNQPFLAACARTGLPVILSTGMSDMAEIDQAVADLAGAPLAVLHCVSNYPTEFSDVRLRNMTMLAARYPQAITGFSSHTAGIEAELAAVALGAKVLEKHFTLDRADPDLAEHHVSLEPMEMSALMVAVRKVEAAMGGAERVLTPSERANRALARRSVVLTRAVAKGERLVREDLVLIRPGTGIMPRHMEELPGRVAARDLVAWQALQWEDLV